MISPDKIFDAAEEVGQCAFYALAGAALLVGACWAVSCMVAHKSFEVIKKKN